MSDQGETLLTKEILEATAEDERVPMVEEFLLQAIRVRRPDGTQPVLATSRLADLAIDSLELVELKFDLDQVLGREVDIELIISNPTVGELASGSVRAAGL